MPDQKAERIVKILRDQVFTLVGPPQQLHSDQGQNFESHILSELCKAFQVTKSHTTPYHPMGDGLVERMNIGHCLTFCEPSHSREIGNNTYSCCCLYIVQQNIPALNYLPMK